MNKLAVIAVVMVLALVGLWEWGVFEVAGAGELNDAAGPGRQDPGAATSSRTPATGELGATAATAAADRTALEDPTTTETADPRMVVTVVDSFGKAMAGATVWRWRAPPLEETQPEKTQRERTESKKAEELPTDSQGCAGFPAAQVAGGIVVLAKGHLAATQRLESLTGDHQIQLQPGARVQGWIRVDGETPTEPIRLRLVGRHGTDPYNEFPAHLQKVVKSRRFESQAVVMTAHHGAFEFAGLPEDWAGNIRLPMHLSLRGRSLEEAEEPFGYQLAKPRTGLQLETTALPGVRGRVVWHDTGEGVPKTRLWARAEFANGQDLWNSGLYTDERGYFRLGFGFGVSFGAGPTAEQTAWANAKQRPPIRKIMLYVSTAGARKLEKEVLDPGKLVPPDYVEIRLQRALMLHFLAVDPDGQPLKGAVFEGARRSQPSDDAGHGTVEVEDLARRRFLAAAPGHLVAEVEARAGAGTPESPLEFVLAKSNKLVVVVRDADGLPPQDLSLAVRTRQPMFTGSEDGRRLILHHVVGTNSSGGMSGHGKMEFYFRLGETGEVVLASLRPGVPCQLVVLDKLKQEVLVRDVVTPTAAEAKRIELRLEGKPLELTGLVVDVHDQPIARATVMAWFESHGIPSTTDSHGRFRFEGGYPTGRKFKLKVSCRGYARTQRQGIAITKGMQPIMIRLLPGYDLKVTFVDRNGGRLPVNQCQVTGSSDIERKRLEPGLLLIRDLPAGLQVLTTDIGGRKYEMQHDPAVSSSARFVLPAMGRLQIEAPRPQQQELVYHYAKITARSDGKSFWLGFTPSPKVSNLRTREFLLLPGEYTVEVLARPGEGPYHTLHPVKPMTVQAGALSRCRFGRQ